MATPTVEGEADYETDATCVSVDISRRLDNNADVILAVGTVPDENCEGPKPTP